MGAQGQQGLGPRMLGMKETSKLIWFGWVGGWAVGWLVRWLVCCLFCLFVCLFVGRLAGWFGGLFVCLLGVWLAG